MAQVWGPQDDSDPDDIDNWMARRNAQFALRPTADAIARDLWNQSTLDGGDLYAGNPSDLAALGLSALGGAGPYSGMAANDDDQTEKADGIAAGSQDEPPLSSAGGVGAQQRPSVADSSADSAPAGDPSTPSVSELEVVGRPPAQTPGPAPRPSFLDSLNHNPVVRGAAGLAGYVVGLPFGVGRAGMHAVEGIGD
ncbi:MAG TPA: hypothetical protein VFW13_00450, partial [Phenylobacterium sp.]|nr:hypothetical protein [Phenylobacterium sp.]